MKYYVGVGKFSVIQFNPTREWLNERGMAVKSTPVYTGRDRDIPTAKVVACLQSVEYDFITFATFDLKQTPLTSKAGKTCFINSKYMTSWATDESELSSIFHGGNVHIAVEGEQHLAEFLKIGMQDYPQFNVNKWFEGDFSELNQAISNEDFGLVGASVVVETSRDGRLKNKVYTKKFIPEKEVEHFYNSVFGKLMIKKLLEQETINRDKSLTAGHKRYLKDWEKLLAMMNDPYFPCQDFFYNGQIKPYVDKENIITTSDLLIK